MAKRDIAKLGRGMVLLGTYDEYDEDTIIEVLTAADDLYYNDEQSFLEDNEYDALRKYAEAVRPYDIYFTGVGSNIRGGKVKLPYQMGSLDQVEIGEITDWVGEWGLQKKDVVVTDKLDGTSAMVIYGENGDLQIAYSRGNGIEGADITRHIKHLVPSKIARPAVIRGEVIIPKEKFPIVRELVTSRSGQPYKNARNMVAGVMNASTNDPVVYDYLHFVAYDILGETNDKCQMLEDLGATVGFYIPHWTVFEGRELTDSSLANYLEQRRAVTEYEIDGLVIDVDGKHDRARMNPTRDTLNPAYAIKYKVADADNQAIATVKKVHWNPSKHGYLKPRVEIEPVDLVGVTIKHATGFNAKFIMDNGIGPGAKVRITRSGDVIPFIQAVVEGAYDGAEMPGEYDKDWAWNDTAVDAVMIEHNEEVMIQQAVDFFASIDAPHLKEGNVRTMFDQNNYSDITHALLSMLNYDVSHWESCIGANGTKIHNGIRTRLDDMPLYVLAGSVPYFGRGVGKRKFKKLITELNISSIVELTYLTSEMIVFVDGFEQKTARKIDTGMTKFLQFVNGINDLNITYNVSVAGGAMEGQKVVFTGFRDKALQAQVEEEGGTMQSAVSGKTTILVASNPNSNSGKMKKARDKGVRVMGIDEFKDLL